MGGISFSLRGSGTLTETGTGPCRDPASCWARRGFCPEDAEVDATKRGPPSFTEGKAGTSEAKLVSTSISPSSRRAVLAVKATENGVYKSFEVSDVRHLTVPL